MAVPAPSMPQNRQPSTAIHRTMGFMEHCLPLVSCSGGGTLPPFHVLRVAGTIAKEWTRRPDGIAGFEMRRLILKLRSHQTWPRRPSSRQCALNMIDELAMLRSSIAAETREGPRQRDRPVTDRQAHAARRDPSP